MLFQCRRIVFRQIAKLLSTTTRKNFKVTILGGAGGIGQNLGLLLKKNPRISHLALYDISKLTPGIGVDLSHINTSTTVNGYSSDDDGLTIALNGSSVVIITAGKPRTDVKKFTRHDLFKSNAKTVYDLLSAIKLHCPAALIVLATDPINSVVPLASELMKKWGLYNPSKIFGVTKLDEVRAATFVAAINKCDPARQYIPVFGGHSTCTIIPLLSRANPPINLSEKEKIKLIKKIRHAGAEVINAKAGTGSATLSMAHATAQFTDSLLKGLWGEENVVDVAFIRTCVTNVPYFSSHVVLGPAGVQKIPSIGEVDPYENKLIMKSFPYLEASIHAAKKFLTEQDPPPTSSTPCDKSELAPEDKPASSDKSKRKLLKT